MKIPEISDAELVAIEERSENALEMIQYFLSEQPEMVAHIKLTIDLGICHWTCLGTAAFVYLALKAKLEGMALEGMLNA